ncbi:MAG: MoxR family ATPase [Planctomycetes bacterium]|nr:MoxR family ATPase [Planctomycetota bacterium]
MGDPMDEIHIRETCEALREEIGKVIVGQKEVIRGVLTALVAGGHVLLEGLPGTGKTALVGTLADVVELGFQRIQCTPDLMPTDIIGTYVIMESAQGRRSFEFQKGPLFSNLVLAEQINRTTPKTQSALLEAMDEASITVSTETFPLPEPFFLVATQNPLEMEGTYPLPEAQIDRFFCKLVVRPPDADEMEEILDRTTEAADVITRKIVDGRRIGEMGELVRKVPIAVDVRRWAISVVAATQPDSDGATESVKRYVRYGCGPRGAQAMVLAAKIRAILEGRFNVSTEDLRSVGHAALRHRVVLNFEGQGENVQTDAILDDVFSSVAPPG